MQNRFHSYAETIIADGYEVAEAVPTGDLRGTVLRYQGFQALSAVAFSDRVTAGLFLPVIINFGERWRISSGGVSPSRFDSFAAGLSDHFTDVMAVGRPTCLQIDLTPFGARTFFRQPLHQIADGVVDLFDLLGKDGLDLVDRLACMSDWKSRLALADDFVRARTRAANRPDRLALAA